MIVFSQVNWSPTIPGRFNSRGYGDFPSNKKTWIKADPSFEGLLQAIKEPAMRSYIGDIPPKLEFIERNRSCFLDSLSIDKIGHNEIDEDWLANTRLPLNQDLIAIIGNKGSGKSALADIIAMVGNSKQNEHFSFLKKNRFRGQNGIPAKYFNATLSWKDGESNTLNLNENQKEESIELVKYIPQNRFEQLCNDHVSGETNAFETELREAIYSHIDNSDKCGMIDLDSIIKEREGSLNITIEGNRAQLAKLNKEICEIEVELSPQNKKNIEEKIKQVNQQITEHEKLKPKEIEKPAIELDEEQRKISGELTNNAESITKIDKRLEQIKEEKQVVFKILCQFIKLSKTKG